MTSYLSKRLDVFVAAESAYGQENADVVSFRQIRPESDGFEHTGVTPILARELATTDLNPHPGLAGAPSCSLALRLPARGGGAVTADAQEATPCPELSALLHACVADIRRDKGATIQAQSATTIQIASGTPRARFTPGGLVFVELAEGAPSVGRWISGLDDDTQTLTVSGAWRGASAWNLPQPPAVGGGVAACVNLLGNATTPASVCVVVNGLPRDGIGPVWSYTGLLGNLKIEDSAAMQRVLLSFDLKGDAYALSDQAPRVSLAAGAQPFVARPSDLRALSADLRINGVPTAYRSFSLDIGNRYSERLNANAPTGRDGYVLTGREVTGSCLVYWDATQHGRFRNGDAIDLSWIIGNGANGVGFHAPCCEIREVKERDVGGLLGMELRVAVLACDIAELPAWTLAFSGALPTP